MIHIAFIFLLHYLSANYIAILQSGRLRGDTGRIKTKDKNGDVKFGLVLN